MDQLLSILNIRGKCSLCHVTGLAHSVVNCHVLNTVHTASEEALPPNEEELMSQDGFYFMLSKGKECIPLQDCFYSTLVSFDTFLQTGSQEKKQSRVKAACTFGFQIYFLDFAYLFLTFSFLIFAFWQSHCLCFKLPTCPA